jgi:hypothetical protein
MTIYWRYKSNVAKIITIIEITFHAEKNKETDDKRDENSLGLAPVSFTMRRYLEHRQA